MRYLFVILVTLAVCMMLTPPALARIESPLFGVNWTPDICDEGAGGREYCLGTYMHVQLLNNESIDYAWLPGTVTDVCNNNTDIHCVYGVYQAHMDGHRNQGCYYTFIGDNWMEMEAWCNELFNIAEQETLQAFGLSGGGCNIC